MTAPATPAPADGAPGERVSVDARAVADLQRMLTSWWANVGHDLGGPQTAELYAALRTIAATAAPLPDATPESEAQS